MESAKYRYLRGKKDGHTQPHTGQLQQRTAPLQPPHQQQNTPTHGQHICPHLVPFSGWPGMKVMRGLFILCSTQPQAHTPTDPPVWACVWGLPRCPTQSWSCYPLGNFSLGSLHILVSSSSSQPHSELASKACTYIHTQMHAHTHAH